MSGTIPKETPMNNLPDLLLAIDPGPKFSAFVIIERHTKQLDAFGIVDSYEMLLEIDAFLDPDGYDLCESRDIVVEMVASYGMPVGRSIFDTVLMIGRYLNEGQSRVRLMTRNKVKNEICQSSKAKDSNVRQALIDLYGPTKEKAIGLKKTPGPLYGVSKDVWAALALAIAAANLWDFDGAFYTETINID